MIGQAVVLAGGLATRLKPYTISVPKSMVVVAGRPFIAYQLDYLSGNGVKRVVLCIGHLGEQIERHIGDGSRFGLAVTYSPDGDTPLGTGGALKRAEALLDETFWVMYGDSYLRAPLAAVAARYCRCGAPGLMTVYRNDGRYVPSNVEFSDGRVVRYDKASPTPAMAYVDYGLAILARECLRDLPDCQPFDLAAVYEDLVASGRMAGYEVDQRFYEIGSLAGLDEFRRYVASRSRPSSAAPRTAPARSEESPMNNAVHVEQYLNDVATISRMLDRTMVERALDILLALQRDGGRLFVLGVGGGAGNASHAVNDFRKIAGIESYAPTDNASELTARINDDGWETAYSNWLAGSHLGPRDAVLIFSVGGGDLARNISANLVRALQYARRVGAKILAVVGRDGGYAGQVADAAVIVPTVSTETVTAHTESFQSIIWHLLVSHPALRKTEMKWESTT